MRKQQPGMSPYPGHHPSSKEMQLWQQHLMLKQLPELQRKQQFQQLDQGARQQILLSQAAARHSVVNQLPSVLNGMPINDASSHMLPNDIMGGEPKTPSSSHMFTAESTNWAQGRCSPGTHGSNRLMLTNDHGQAMRPVGFVPQQLDQSLYGTPVSTSRGLLNQYPQIQGIPNNFADVMAKAVRNQLEKAPAHSVPSNFFQMNQCVPEQACLRDGLSVAVQGFQGNFPVQSLSSGTTSGNFQQVNDPQQNNQSQEFQDRQDQACWSSNVEEKAATQVGPSRGVTSLDPTEERILFGTDDDGNLGTSFGSIMGTGGNHGDPLEGNDQFGTFPSLQSGSWSALMQEAVQATSSDKGFQEEMSGLSVQNMEPSFGNPSTSSMHNDIAKHQSSWDNSDNFQSASSVSLRPSPFFNDAISGPPFPAAATFQHSPRTAYEENNRVQIDASHESFQQSSKDEQDMHLDRSHKQKQILDGRLQSQIQSNDVHHDVWSKQMHEKLIKSVDSGNTEFNLQNNRGSWTHQERMLSSNINRQPDANLTGWNKSLATHGGSTSEGLDKNRTLYAENGGNSSTGMAPVKSDIGSSHICSAAFSTSNFAAVMNSKNLNANQEANQHTLNSYQVVLGKHVAFDSFVKPRGENVEAYKHQPRKGQQTQASSANSADPSPSMSDSQTSSGMSGWKSVGSRRIQSHNIENLSMNVEPAESPKETAYSQSMPKLVMQQLKSQEQDHVDNTQFSGQGVSSRGKVHSAGMQRIINSLEETQYKGTMPRQTSQNMLELLHKVDNSRDDYTVACFSNSDLNTVDDTHEAGPADGSVSHPHHHQSPASQGFGLHLGSPSQRQQVQNHDLHSQSSLCDFKQRQVDSDAGDKDQMQSTSTGSDYSLHHTHEASQKENSEGRSNFSVQNCKEISQLIAQGNFSAVNASNLSYMARQLQLQKQQQLLRQQQLLQQQHISSLTGREVINQSGNITPGSHADIDERIKQASLLRRAQLFRDMALANQSGQTSSMIMAGRMLPFRLDSSADAHGPGSQFTSHAIGHSQPTNAGFYHLKSSAQQHPLVETGPSLQACARSGLSQQIGFSTMLQNEWANASVQQVMSCAQPQKLVSNVPQSIILSNSDRDKNTGAVQMDDDQGNKGGSDPSELGTCSRNSQQLTDADRNPGEESLQGTDSESGDGTPKTGIASEEQEHVPKHQDRNYAVSISSLGHPPHDVNRRKQVPSLTASNSDVGLYGHTDLQSNVQQPSYSLLQQMQAMKGADSDASRRDGKRLKGEYGSDASHTEWRAGQGYMYCQNAVSRVLLSDELGASSHSAFPSDVKMLSFSSKENEEKNAERTGQLIGRECLSQSICLSDQPDLQNQTQPPTSTSNFIGRRDHPLLCPQMDRSWFEQYRKYKNGQILTMYADQKSAKAVPQQYYPAEVSARIDNTTLVEQRIETSHFGALSQSMSASNRAANEFSQPHLPLGVSGHDMANGSRKRKTATPELLPWHQVVALGVQRLQNISLAERDWAQAANRLTEKVEDASEMIEDGSLFPNARRRLILTTQLMQQLLPSVPAPILAAKVTSAHEIVTYFLAKTALGDACSLISCSSGDSGEHLDSDNRTSKKQKTSERASEVIFSKVVEDFIGRSTKLETDFSRLDKRTSLLDVRLEWQEVERISLINQLGKFHGRSQADRAESSSASQNAPRKIFPQRYVTAFSMPGNVPEGVLCLTL